MSPNLHSDAQVLSLRHGGSWMLLAASAGATNAGAFVACERFVTHVTGTVTSIGMDVGVWELMLEYALVLAAFIIGAMMSVFAIQARIYRGRRPLHALPLLAVAGVLGAASVAGQLGLFGPLGGQVEESRDFALLCVLAFAMGLMNASVATSTGSLVRATHMTGPATDFGVNLTIAWLATGEERIRALQLAALRGGKLVSFGVGAGLMVTAVQELEYLAFVFPALMVLTATARSFMPRRSAAERDEGMLAAG